MTVGEGVAHPHSCLGFSIGSFTNLITQDNLNSQFHVRASSAEMEGRESTERR